MRKESKKVSIEDVAKAAGVSTTTVSRVINQVETVSEENREKVLEAIRMLKYRPNPSAQHLAAGRNNTLGIVIPRFADMFRSFYIAELFKGVGTATEQRKFNLLLHVTDESSFLDMGAVDGILFADIDGNEDQLDWVIDQGIPCVVLNHYVEDLPVSCVAVDNRLAAEQVVNYFVQLGHRDIATITGHLRTPVGIERLDGYLRAMKHRGLEVKSHFVQYGDYTAASAQIPARDLLGHPDRPTAIFAASDDMAVAVIEQALEMGLRVPEDVSVIGFDDSPIAAVSRVPLTTVWQPLSRVGEVAVELLTNIVESKQHHPVKRLLGTKIIERQSCRQTWIDAR